MNVLVLNTIVALIALVVIFSIWIGVHLISNRRTGERENVCHGTISEIDGGHICCKKHTKCELQQTPDKDT